MLRPTLVSILTFLFLLYSFQGILYGLQSKFLPVALRTKGSSLTFIGSLNVISLPWLVKSAIAPLIDLYSTPTWWLRLTITGITTSLLGLHISQDSVRMFAVVLFMLNVFSACQDVVIGKVLLNAIAGHQSVNVVSSIQILAYKTGILIGGGGMLLMSSSTLITHSGFIIIALVFLPLLLLFTNDHRSQPELVSLSEYQAIKPEVSRGPHANNQKVKKSNSVPYQLYHITSHGSMWLITCLLLYKYTSHSCHMLFTMVLVDQGVTMETIGMTSGIVGHLLSIAVAMVVGIILTNTRVTAFHMLYGVAMLDTLGAVLQLWLVLTQVKISTQMVLLVFIVQHLVLGAQSTPAYSLILTHTQQQTNQATQYSLFTTIETVGSKLSLFITGLLAEYFGYTTSFVISFIASVVYAGIIWYTARNAIWTKNKQ